MHKMIAVAAMSAGFSLAASGRDPGPKGDPGAQGPAGPQGAQGIRSAWTTRPRRRAGASRPAGSGEKGDKGDPATVNIRAVQADGAVNCDSSEALVSVFCPSGGAADGAKCVTSPTLGLCMKK
jgi:hypothetical protein